VRQIGHVGEPTPLLGQWRDRAERRCRAIHPKAMPRRY